MVKITSTDSVIMNCGGNHGLAYGGCEVMKRGRETQQVRAQSKITYAETVKMVSQGKGYDEKSRVGRRLTAGPEQENEGKVMMDLKRLVTFIAGVVNATMGVISKTERIQRIVKAAAHHLDVTGLTWEKVQNDLSAHASQEHSWVG